MILLEFIFQSFWHFLGCLVLLVVACDCIQNLGRSVSNIFRGPRY